MKRIMLLVAVLVVAIAVLASASGIDDLPDEVFSMLIVKDWDESMDFLISFMDWCPSFLEAYLDESSPEARNDMLVVADTIFTNNWGEDRRVLYVVVSAGTYDGSAHYFYPTNIVFAQDHRVWVVENDDCMVAFMENGFSGRIYGTFDGFIVLPSELDWTREFTIWYDEDRATFGPLKVEPGS